MNINWARVNSFVGNSSSPALTFYRRSPICGSIKSRVVMELDNFQFYSDSSELPKRVNVRENQFLDSLLNGSGESVGASETRSSPVCWVDGPVSRYLRQIAIS